VTTKESKGDSHPQGRDYHSAREKVMRHIPAGTQSGRKDPTVKGGPHKTVRPSGSHRGR
jgi:hypothetical protein